jgi:ketosteroid isomerase-like protein
MRFMMCGAVVCLVIGVAVPAVAGSHDEGLMAEVAAIGDALAEAMIDDDVEFILGMYTENAISLPNYGPRMDGVDAFRKSHDEMAADGMKVVSFDSHPTDVWECGDQVIEIGTFKIELEMPGMPGGVRDEGKYLTIYVRAEDGSLKIKAETWNTDMNPMEVAAGG